MELLAGRSAGRGLSAGGSARRRAFSGSPLAPRASFLLPAPLRAANAPLEPLQPATHTAAVPTRAARRGQPAARPGARDWPENTPFAAAELPADSPGFPATNRDFANSPLVWALTALDWRAGSAGHAFARGGCRGSRITHSHSVKEY